MNNNMCEIQHQVLVYQLVHNIAHKSRNSYWWFHNTKEHVYTYVYSHPPSDDEECSFEMFFYIFTVGRRAVQDA